MARANHWTDPKASIGGLWISLMLMVSSLKTPL